MRYGSGRDDPADWGRGRTESAPRRSYQWEEPGQHGWGEPRRGRQSGARQDGARQYQDGAPGRPAPGGRRAAQASRRARGGTGFRAKSLAAKMGYAFVSITAVLGVVAGLFAYSAYNSLKPTSVTVPGLTGRTVYGPLSVLVLGSQERKGQRGFFGHEVDPGTTNSDNLLLVRLDSTHRHATVLSIPRDLFVYQPACKERSYVGTGTWPAQEYPPGAIIDGAMNIGGPACAVKTVEALTGIKLDHVIVFDFNSFRKMVDAIGGVEVCVPPGPGYHDTASHLNLSPGKHLVTYTQALAYVRVRHSIGTGVTAGGDLPRIQLQQAFISSISQKVEHENLFANIPQLYSLAKTAAKALTVDQNLRSAGDLVSLAKSLISLKSKNINLITVPTQMDTYQYPNFSSHSMAVQPQDDLLYQMARTGQIWHGHLPTTAYGTVRVKVVNGTGIHGLAKRTGDALRKLGFEVVGVGDATATSNTTVDFAGEQQAKNAYTLETVLKGFKTGYSPGTTYPNGVNTRAEPAWQVGTPGTITLILGADFHGVNPPAAGGTPATSTKGTGKTGPGSSPGGNASGVSARNAAANICTGLPPAFKG